MCGALRSKFDFMCINFSIGYYDYHSPNEYVVLEDVFKGFDMGRKMVQRLGNKLYYKERKSPNYNKCSLELNKFDSFVKGIHSKFRENTVFTLLFINNIINFVSNFPTKFLVIYVHLLNPFHHHD